MAVLLLAWMVAVPCAMAMLLGPEANPMAPLAPDLRIHSAAAADAMDAILQRPLFTRSRRPPPPPMVQAAPTPVAMAMRDRTLVVRGIVIWNNAAKAFVAGSGTPDGTWVSVGDEIGGWHVAAIEPRDVRFEGGDERLTAAMNPTGVP